MEKNKKIKLELTKEHIKNLILGTREKIISLSTQIKYENNKKIVDICNEIANLGHELNMLVKTMEDME